jgi:hypothetical protein
LLWWVADAQRFGSANYGALSAELAQDAAEVKARCDDALGALVDAQQAREAVSRRATALAALVGTRGRDLVPESRLGPVVKEANRVLMLDGERAPIVREPPVGAIA